LAVAAALLPTNEQSVAKHREHPEYKTFAGAFLSLLENGQASLDVHQFNELQ
jgi:hypothetical protein